MKELQEDSSKLAQLFRHGLVVALPSLIYQLHFVTHFAGKAAPKAFARLYYFPCSLANTSVSFANFLQYLPLEKTRGVLSLVEPEQSVLLGVLTENYHRSTTTHAALHSHLAINGVPNT